MVTLMGREVLGYSVREEEGWELTECIGKHGGLTAAMSGDFDHFKYVMDVGQIDVDDVDLRDRRTMVTEAPGGVTRRRRKELSTLGRSE